MGTTLILPRDRPGDGAYAALAAQLEAGVVRVVQDRRAGPDRRQDRSFREHGQRTGQRRRMVALPVLIKVVRMP
ncbi:MAG: hypothetical protein A3K12_04075 [Candidatus Rokubacteria bacterium RIFCSPLOWO2_12_FULL_71_19]|nr:MAG: hypothetical protein A3K12_04075 [Candidatus Rokubacteria bacterium RIFCSPLOWO2_12_FULL_71_19]